jgi:predicted ATP-dependent serine protease
MFLCDDCAKPYANYWLMASHGKCEDCGKYGKCNDVPHQLWVRVDDDNRQKRKEKLGMYALAVSTYPCPVCGKVDFSDGCECGFMSELMQEIREGKE